MKMVKAKKRTKIGVPHDLVKVMIVDDDPLIRQLYRELLRRANYEIIGEATNGEEALSQFKELEEQIDLILLDHKMPKKDGLTVAKEIIENNPRVKILMITGDPTLNSKIVIECGINYKQKPANIQEIITAIDRLV